MSSAKVWWKKHLTTLQIVQFILDLAVCYSNAYTHFAFNYFPRLPNYGDCSTTDGAALFGCALLSSYLLLFVDFFIRTYQKASARKVANGKSHGTDIVQSPIVTPIVQSPLGQSPLVAEIAQSPMVERVVDTAIETEEVTGDVTEELTEEAYSRENSQDAFSPRRSARQRKVPERLVNEL